MAAINRTQRALLTGALALFMVLAGCQTINDVTVDAISNTAKPLGISYRLEVNDLSGGVEKELQAEAIACIRNALAARGLYEAPPGTRSDMDITFEYGVGPPHIKFINNSNSANLLDPSFPREPGTKPIVVFEKFIKLSAREPAAPSVSSARRVKLGDEVWSVHVSVEDTKKDLPPYLPVLASACIDYIGQNSRQEQHLTVKTDDAKVSLRRGGSPPSSPP